jgi:hypothetical protein
VSAEQHVECLGCSSPTKCARDGCHIKKQQAPPSSTQSVGAQRYRPYFWDTLKQTGQEATMRANSEGAWVAWCDYEELRSRFERACERISQLEASSHETPADVRLAEAMSVLRHIAGAPDTYSANSMKLAAHQTLERWAFLDRRSAEKTSAWPCGAMINDFGEKVCSLPEGHPGKHAWVSPDTRRAPPDVVPQRVYDQADELNNPP